MRDSTFHNYGTARSVVKTEIFLLRKKNRLTFFNPLLVIAVKSLANSVRSQLSWRELDK